VTIAMTELEVARELKSVRRLLAEYRANGENDEMLYGAQQALVWVLGRGLSPSRLEEVIHEVAKELP
jgi:hypothetical protein